MPRGIGRLEFLRQNPGASPVSQLHKATQDSIAASAASFRPSPTDFSGKSVVIIGAGVSGLTAAYELSKSLASVTVLEARSHTGGRCLSLRDGDVLSEDRNSDLYTDPSLPKYSQTVHFDRPSGDSQPYLNAGPGRIPSSHVFLLDYLHQFAVPLEIYVMNSMSNLSQMHDGPLGEAPVVNRRLVYNSYGWLNQMIYQNAQQLLKQFFADDPDVCVDGDMVTSLQSLATKLGDLNTHGEYVVSAPADGEVSTGGSDRAGYLSLPNADAGEIAPALPLKSLLDSSFWTKSGLYQSDDILWQPTLFQPVGGMDHVERAFRDQAVSRGVTVICDSPVLHVSYDSCKKMYTVRTADTSYTADYVLCNAAMPFLQRMLAPEMFKSFDEGFQDGLTAVYDTQAKDGDPTKRFLAYTTKVGWQAPRSLWELRPVSNHEDGGLVRASAQDSEQGVVPIFGGISWTDDDIDQIWYPSTGYNEQLGVLTGCYNFTHSALRFGEMDIHERLCAARSGAKKFGTSFGAALSNGVAIAWQNQEYIKGGWAQWQNVTDNVIHFNNLQQGSAVAGGDIPTFFVIGDQLSSLPGWQEGAVASALKAVSRMVNPQVRHAPVKTLGDTRLMVEGLRG